jgi:Zn-finger nucleic acid-binding protein
MKCPNCNVNLVMTDRSGVEIDYCPDCRGVWLDRGELDKIIERSSKNTKDHDDDDRDDDRHDDRQRFSKDNEYHHKKKKKGFFDDLFDF